MRKDPGPKARWDRIISKTAQIALAEMVLAVCAKADADANARYRHFTKAHYRGQTRYTDMEEALLALCEQFPELRSAQLEFHLGFSARFAALHTSRLRITNAKLKKWSDNPFKRPFRCGKISDAQQRRFKGGQMQFWPPPPAPKGRLIAAICYGFIKSDPAHPYFIHVRFADVNWLCCDEYVDLLAMLNESRSVATEAVADDRQTTIRTEPTEVTGEDVSDTPSIKPRETDETKKKKDSDQDGA